MQPSPQPMLEHFYQPKKKPRASELAPRLNPSSPRQPLFSLLSLSICLSWILCTSGIIYYMICDWLLSPSVTFARFIHIAACVSASSLWPNNILQRSHAAFCCRSIRYGHVGWFRFGAIINIAALNICVQGFVWTCLYFPRIDA